MPFLCYLQVPDTDGIRGYKIIIKNMSDHKHVCDATVLTCIDFRIHKNHAIAEFLKSSFEAKTFDLITRPGSIKALAESSSAVISDLLNQIRVSYDLHGSRKIFLINHSDCGAYGIADKQAEKEKQLLDMETAENTIKSRYSDAYIIKIWAQLKDPEGNEIEFEVIK